jgi:hypothetical protein
MQKKFNFLDCFHGEKFCMDLGKKWVGLHLVQYFQKLV